MIETVQQRLKAEGHEVSIQKLCEWFGLPRRTFNYKNVKSAPKVQERFEKPIKAMIEENPSFGYRTVAVSGRDTSYLAPPGQIRASGTTALGSFQQS